MDDQFLNGLLEANRLIRKDPGAARYWLERAKRSKRRIVNRLFRRRKCRFLSGFVVGLEWELVQAPGDLEAAAETQDGSWAIGDFGHS